jgi:hypothetical protein
VDFLRMVYALNDVENLLLCLPDIADAMAGKSGNEADKKGWVYLRSMFHKWFSGSANPNPNESDEPFWVDWDWVMSYQRARAAYEEFISHESWMAGPHIMNEAARTSLANYLCNNGYMGEHRKTFDFISQPWPNWQEEYHTLKAVQALPFDDGLETALGAFTLRALAAGYTEKNGKGGYTVYVSRVAVFVHDVFNFEDDGGLNDSLGYWSCSELKGGYWWEPEAKEKYQELHDSSFRNFRDTFGCGGNFLVLSLPHTVEDFPGVRYECTCA